MIHPFTSVTEAAAFNQSMRRRIEKTESHHGKCETDQNKALYSMFGMGHQPETMSELYSHLFEEVEKRLAEPDRAGAGFPVPAYRAPNCSKVSAESEVEIAV